jgi:hypothetical protein
MSDREDSNRTSASSVSWTVMLALLTAASAGCEGDSPLTRQPGHPCFGQGGCATFRQRLDGTVEPLPASDAGQDGGAPIPAGELRLCGACNG